MTNTSGTAVLIQSSDFPLPTSGYQFIKGVVIYTSDDPIAITKYIVCRYRQCRTRRFVLNIGSALLGTLIPLLQPYTDVMTGTTFICTLSTSDTIRTIAPSNFYFAITNDTYFFSECIRFSNAAHVNSYLIYNGTGPYYTELVTMCSAVGIHIVNVATTTPSDWAVLQPLIAASKVVLISAATIPDQVFITSKLSSTYSGRIFFIEIPPLDPTVVSTFAPTVGVFTFYPQTPFVSPISSIINTTLRLPIWEFIPYSWQAVIYLCNSIGSIPIWIQNQLISAGYTDYSLSSMKVLLI